MQVIGITGGVGCGKSALLTETANRYGQRVCVIRADDIANEVKEPGGLCYNKIVSVVGEDVLDTGGTINRRRMADKIFSDQTLLREVNAILHPAVHETILAQIGALRQEKTVKVCLIEAALLIEGGYKEQHIVDELWVIFAPEETRRRRLKESRGYSDEKIDSIMKEQLSDAAFQEHADVLIDNSGSLNDALDQMTARLDQMIQTDR